jgi:serine/threonine protein kinase/Flp pilus assembly protein TadD
MATPAVSATVCLICGEPLLGRPDCLACLVRGGLDEASEGAGSRDSLVFGHFEIERRDDGSFWELGHGAMGVTYRARDKVLHRDVALKVIEVPAEGSGARAARERFLREARAAAALRHPNVAGVFQFGAPGAAERCYYAMELVEGETLEAIVRREGPLPVGAALGMAIQVTRALVAAAAHGLIHRDLKPANIMLAPNESGSTEVGAKVIDFGLAKATTEAAGERDLTCGGFVGTPTFASPEQLGSAPVDARSDIYSLGVTLWYALTGEIPWPGKTIEEIRKAQTELPLPLEQLRARRIPAAVIRLLRATLAVDPGRRPAAPRELLVALESCRNQLTVPNESGFRRAGRRVAILCTLAAILAGAFFTFQKLRPGAAFPGSPREKSIAVLPFENLSDSRENEYFANGIQDDILTSLARINDLKVISRTSASQYRGAGTVRNLREIARELGVENVLEGSVRREGNRVLVNVQLIDARNDRHLWAERYDRTGADSIGLQGELATRIAAALEAKLAPGEKNRLEARPTNNPAAYALYLKGLGRERAVNHSTEDFTVAEQLYGQAIALDPGFALAHARRSIMHSYLGATADDRAQARKSADEAVRLRPSLGEAHMALGLCLYWADKNYTAALTEFSRAATTAPNEPDIFHYIAGIYRRQGRWRESLAAYEHAQELDPRDLKVITQAAADYLLVRDWPAATACFNRALEIASDSAIARLGLAYLEVFRNSNPAAGETILQSIPAGIDPDGKVTKARWDLAMLKRDFDTAEKILRDFPSDEYFPNSQLEPKSYSQGRVAFARGDLKTARRFLEAATPEIETYAREHPDAESHANLGLLYAYVGRKTDAIREARQAVEMEPESQNAFHGAAFAGSLALVYARTGEADQAIALIERLLSAPGLAQWPDFPQNITLADLRLRLEWDPLRSDPRFQKILAAPEPKTVY